MIIKVEKRHAFIIMGLLVLGIGIFVVNALASGIDISQGYHGSNQISVSVSGTEKTLQEAINDGSFGVPSGFCIFSDVQTSCPSGWERRAQFDGKTMRGVVVKPGGIGGSDSHSHIGPIHAHSFTSGGPSAFYGSYAFNYAELKGPSTTHVHSGTTDASGTGPTGKTSSWPPYMNVIICCKV